MSEDMARRKQHFKKIIFIIADTLRAKNVGLYGNVPSPTPNIDKLGEHGVVFLNTYTSITATDPSISSIMSGTYPLRLGIVNHGPHVTMEEEKTLKQATFLSEVLKNRGYKTAAIDWLGRWHKRGYDYYSGRIVKGKEKIYPIFDRLPFPLFLRILDKIAIKYLRREFFIRFYYAFFPNPNIPYDPANVVVDEAIKILSKNENEKLFLYLHFWDAHAPHTRPRGISSYLTDNIEDTYNAEIEFLDGQIGRLIDYLEKNGQLDDALIVLTADHGENLYEHDVPFNHENLYEDVVKVPLIFRYAGSTPQKIESPVQQVDIFSTVLDICGISNKTKNIDSKSLLPLIKRGTKSRKVFYFEDFTYRKINYPANTRRRGLRKGDYKYIETLIGKPKDLYAVFPREDQKIVSKEVFNLKKDPGEKINLAHKNNKLTEELSTQLAQLVQDLNFKRLKTDQVFKKKVEKSIYIIRKAAKKYPSDKIGIAWTGGKDSTVLLHLVRLAFDGKVPFKVIFNDSTMEFEEIYEFIDKMKKLWGLDLITIKHSKKELKDFEATSDRERKKELSRLMKITAINHVVKKYKLKALIAGIRWDEHESRSKETYFSKRKDHDRVHPILHFKEKDIWDYIHHFGVPYVNLYAKGYRSLGEKPFTKKAEKGGGERSGREREKEQLMQNLRKLGYW